MSETSGPPAPRGRALFLRSRIARRIFGVLLVAALLPTTLVAWLGHQAFIVREEARAERHAKERLKHMGLRLYDRLDAARSALAVHAGHAPWHSQETLPSGASSPSKALGRVRALSTSNVHEAPPLLAWQPVPGEAARVQLAQADAAGRGWWLADVPPEYLWSDFHGEGAGAGLCVLDAAGRALFCPRPPGAEAGTLDWRLFMRAGFEADDWRIVGTRHPSAEQSGLAANELPYARLAGLALAGTLFVAALLGLAMVRRTLVPLERLTAGTRRLARGERSARVDLPPGDEFGELAGALNGMATHIEQQLQALEVQARIDRDLLGGHALAQTMAHVIARVVELAPQAACIAIAARDVTGKGWLLYLGDAHTAPRALPAEAATWLAAASTNAAAPAQTALGLPGWWPTAHTGEPASADLEPGRNGAPDAPCAHAYVTCVPAQWRGDTVAWLVLHGAQALALTASARQEIETLRDRVAIALAAAAREHHLVERAVRDSLTGLLNRHGLHDACDHRLAQAAGGGEAVSDGTGKGPGTKGFSAIFIDLDGFKEVNDTLGHPMGDAVLRAVAERLRALIPAEATLARTGGDEFVVLLAGAAADGEQLAQALCQAVALPIAQHQHVVHLGASAGVAHHPSDAGERDELLRRADVAMYAAKAAGRGRWRRYAGSMDAVAAERAWITRELRVALEQRALEVHYQPRIDPRDGRLISAEALVRWFHPERGAIAPMRFVPVAEDTGLIERLGEFVLDTALAQQRRWRDAGLPQARMAVNVSARQLGDPGFAEGIFAALARHGLAPTDLELELTESLFAGDTALVQRAVQPLRAQGVLVALDDFGTGYSSLAALHSLPIDVLKIDRSFVIELGVRDSAEAVVRTVMALARALGKCVVAEGVETAAQEQHLLALGCDEFQGYRYARPMPAAELTARVAAGFAAPAPKNSLEPTRREPGKVPQVEPVAG